MDKLTFYFDRCFGKRFPEALRTANPPFTVQYQHDKRSAFKFRQDMPDDQWLAVAGANDWIVFSHDRKFHQEATECFAVKQYRIGCFYLWGNNATTWEKLHAYMHAHHRIMDAIKNTPRPFIFDVAKNGRLKSIDIP